MPALFMNLAFAILAAAIAAVSVGGAALAQNQTSTQQAESAMSLEDAKQQYLSVWNQTAFNATFSTYVQEFSAVGYGVYEEHEDVFAPGETMVLYVEPEGYDHEQVIDENGDTLYVMNFTADYFISDANGTELQAIEDVPVGMIASHRPNTELFLELSLTQEQPFPVGNYEVRYVITDEVSGESFEIAKQVRVGETLTAGVA
jgi:hypothetical protein